MLIAVEGAFAVLRQIEKLRDRNSPVLPPACGHSLCFLLLELIAAAPVLSGAAGRAAYHPSAMVGAPLLITGAVLIWLAMLHAALWVPGVKIFEGTSALWEPARQAMVWYLSLFEAWHGWVAKLLA